MSTLHAVIMAGGSGTRFWPASRTRRPKQFLPLSGGVPLIGATVDRLQGLCPPDRIWIVTNEVQARELPNVLPSFDPAQVIVEPEARDTAPCVALATATVQAQDPDATMVVLPADHVIRPADAFQTMLRRGVDLAQNRTTLVTFGIPPDHPATGYGYVECGDRLDDREPEARRAVRFREKPDRATAEQFVAAGNFLWNSGIFVWHAAAIRAAMARGNAALDAAAAAMLDGLRGGGSSAARRAAVDAAFRRAPKTSIDYAVMEHAPDVACVRATVRWDDVGSFPALGAVGERDADGNVHVLHGGAAQVACESADNVVYAEGARTVALFGVRDLVVVAVDDAVLVCPKDRAGDLKTLVERVRAEGRTDLL
ncbi:MAG: mannose-1-phosphate guanylyltransferase [Planctomycetota bacterium]